MEFVEDEFQLRWDTRFLASKNKEIIQVNFFTYNFRVRLYVREKSVQSKKENEMEIEE
jgi:hypothetical protein